MAAKKEAKEEKRIAKLLLHRQKSEEKLKYPVDKALEKERRLLRKQYIKEIGELEPPVHLCERNQLPDNGAPVEIDFKAASEAWLKNKKNHGLSYKYICLGKTKDNKECKRIPNANTNYCVYHSTSKRTPSPQRRHSSPARVRLASRERSPPFFPECQLPFPLKTAHEGRRSPPKGIKTKRKRSISPSSPPVIYSPPSPFKEERRYGNVYQNLYDDDGLVIDSDPPSPDTHIIISPPSPFKEEKSKSRSSSPETEAVREMQTYRKEHKPIKALKPIKAVPTFEEDYRQIRSPSPGEILKSEIEHRYTDFEYLPKIYQEDIDDYLKYNPKELTGLKAQDITDYFQALNPLPPPPTSYQSVALNPPPPPTSYHSVEIPFQITPATLQSHIKNKAEILKIDEVLDNRKASILDLAKVAKEYGMKVLNDKKRLTVDTKYSIKLLTYDILRGFLHRVRKALVQNYQKFFP